MTNMDLLHQVDMDIVKEVVRICNAHGFKYYMLGGTMLGAIRYKGFIPWDDDIDLGMPRDDYEAFLELADKDCRPALCRSGRFPGRQGKAENCRCL